jgi:hypothetical protein
MTAQENKQDSPAEGQSTAKPKPDEHDKAEVAKMLTAYEDRPTLVLPGSGKTITGTAVNDWLDDDGNPKFAGDQDAPAAKAQSDEAQSNQNGGESFEDRTARDKAYNEEVLKVAREEKAATK